MSVATAEISSDDILKRKQRTLWGDTWLQFRRHRLAMMGLTVLTVIVVFVMLGPFLYQVDPEYADLTQMSLPPSFQHPFGTDDIGRDQLARNLYGGRISLAVGLSAMIIAITLGTFVGAISGYFNQLDSVLMRFTDMMLALPVLPLLLVIILLFRDTLRSIFVRRLVFSS